MHFSVTANLITPRRVFDAVGGFRNGAPEDMDWCARAKALGFRIGYAEKAVVQHPARRTWAESVRKARRLTNEFFIMFQQKPHGTLRWLVRTFMILLSIGPHGVAVLTSPKLSSWKDRWGAFWVLVKIRVLRFIWAYEVMFRPV
jgi:GT2 family glycosyltransferase